MLLLWKLQARYSALGLIDQEISVFRTIQMSTLMTYFKACNGFIGQILQWIQRHRSQYSTGKVSLKSNRPFRRDLTHVQSEYSLHTDNRKQTAGLLWRQLQEKE
jgi:hypothetical protein